MAIDGADLVAVEPLDPKPQLDQTNLMRFKRMFDDFRDSFAQARIDQQRDQDYYDDKQLSKKQISALRKRRQPEVWTNRIKPAVNGTIGVVARGKTDPRAYPRTPKDEDAADVATDVLRYVGDSNRFQRLKLQCLKDMLIPGCTAAIVEIDEEREVQINQVRWEEYFFDPRSRRDDFDDARYKGVAKWMYGDTVKAMYPDYKDAIDGCIAGAGVLTAVDSTWEDRPDDIGTPWVDKKLRRLMVVEMYYYEAGEWFRVVYCAGGILEHDRSPYVDNKGRTQCAIVAQSAYVDRENRRYGMVRTMIPVQDSINMSRSKALHTLNSRQVQQTNPDAPPIDADLARTEAARPDGVLPSGWNIVPTTDIMQGNLLMQQEAKGEIERMAPIPSLVGRADSSASGRAQLVQSQAGMTEFALLFDGFSDWELRIWRQVWSRVQQFWTDPKFIRVTGDPDAVKFLKVNEVVGINPMTGEEIMENRPADMDMDIIVDSVPDTANVQQEQFAELMDLLKANPQWAAQVPFSVAVEMSSLVNKREFKKKLEDMGAKQQEAQAQQAQQAAQLAQQGAQADLNKTNSETQKNIATANNTEAKTVQMAMEAQGLVVGLPPQGGQF